jgi:hypothetical protein
MVLEKKTPTPSSHHKEEHKLECVREKCYEEICIYDRGRNLQDKTVITCFPHHILLQQANQSR